MNEELPEIGYVRMSPEQMRALAEYLEAHQRDIKQGINDFGDLRCLLPVMIHLFQMIRVDLRV